MDKTVYYSKFCPVKGHYINVPEGTPGARKVIVRHNLPKYTTHGRAMLDPLADYPPPAPTGNGNVIPFKRRT